MRVSVCAYLLPFLALQHVNAGPAWNLAASSTNTTSSALRIHQIPDNVAVSTAFEIKVRIAGGEWEDVSAYAAEVVQSNTTTGATTRKGTSVATFEHDGPVEVEATYLNGGAEGAKIRPVSANITPLTSGSTATFTLNEPRNVVLQIENEIFDVLHLLTNPIDNNVPSEDDPDVIYYGPGLHTSSEPLNITSGQTVYVAAGAVVTVPGVNFDNAENAVLRGRGVLRSGPSAAISVARSSDILVEGIIGFNVLPRSYESRNVTFSNIRHFSAVTWGDGIDIFSSQDVLIDGVFLRTSDDSIAVYNHRGEWYGDSRNIAIRNSILWADVAHPINVGTHGNTDVPESTTGLTIRNIDILDQHEAQVNYQGCIALNAGDSNLIENVEIDNVRVEDFRMGQLFNFRVIFNDKYNTSPGRGIRNVTISNIDYKGTKAAMSVIHGYDSERPIEFIKFKNLTVNGVAIHDTMSKPSWYLTSDFVPAFVGPHVRNLTFEA